MGPTITAAEIAVLYGVAPNTAYKLHRIRPGFPHPTKVGRRSVWSRTQVMADHATLFEPAPEATGHRLAAVRGQRSQPAPTRVVHPAEPAATPGKGRTGKRGPRW